MSCDEQLIRKYALRRLAEIFKVSEEILKSDARFDRELKASSRSDFRRNELDLVDDDIKDVADRAAKKAMAIGGLQITTVGDYCDHMVRSHGVKPKDVARVLCLPKV